MLPDPLASSCSNPAATEGPEQEKLATKKEIMESPLAWLQEEQSDDFLAML